MDTPLPCILHAIDTTGPGGAETVFLDLTENLTLEGYRSVAIIKGPGWVEDQLKIRGIAYYIVKPGSGFSLRYYLALIRIIRQNNVKLIQAHLLGSTLTYSILSLFLGIPLVATLHGRVDVNPNERFIYLKNFLMRISVNRLIAVSNDLANYIAERGLFNKCDICVIYNGIKTENYGKNKLADIRQALQLNEEAILIGSVGNVRPAKAYHVLIEAAKDVVNYNANIHFVIAGHQKAELMRELDVLIDQYGIRKNMHFMGFQQNSAQFLGQMDLFALSSNTEGFSISTIEAMATGLPIVVTRCGGPEEIVAHQVTGLMVPVNDGASFAEALIVLIKDPALQEKLALAGQQHAYDTFSINKLLSLYKNEYLALLPGGN